MQVINKFLDMIFGKPITTDDIDRLFPCPYCGENRHNSYKEGLECAEKHYSFIIEKE